MKIALALLALVATAASANVKASCGNGELEKEIMDFANLLPVEKMLEITLRYYSEDKEFQGMIEFFQSEEFKGLVQDVEALPEIRKLMDYMCDAGIDIYAIVNKLNEILGLPPMIPSQKHRLSTHATDGIRGFLDEIEAILPIDKLKALYEDKMKNSPVWRSFIEQLSSDNFQEIVNKVYGHSTVQKMIKRAKEIGVDLALVVRLLKEMLGIDIPSRP